MSTRRRGFILPTTLMVMTLLTVMLSAAFIMVSAEFRASDNSLAINRASALAQAGLEDYMSRNRGISGVSTYDSLRITYSSGYADVVATRLAAPPGKATIWLIRSSGAVSGSLLSGQTQAQRTVSQLVSMTPGTLPVRGAFAAANPIAVTWGLGHISPIDGSDACNTTDSVALMATVNDTSGVGGNQNPVTPMRIMSSHAVVLDSSHIDWASISAGNLNPDYVVPPWPGGATGYPVYYSSGNLSLSGGHAGILVVQGDLTISTNTSWTGIILVGGRIVAPSQEIGVSIQGAVVTGLNNLTNPGSVLPDTIPRASAQYQGFRWNSCAVSNVTGALSAMSPLRHTFMDTWATY